MKLSLVGVTATIAITMVAAMATTAGTTKLASLRQTLQVTASGFSSIRGDEYLTNCYSVSLTLHYITRHFVR